MSGKFNDFNEESIRAMKKGRATMNAMPSDRIVNRVDLRELNREREQPQHSQVHINSSTEEIVISTDDVLIDEAYQRRVNREWVKEIARNFDVAKFEKPQVARRPDGKFAVIDGQHRISALRERWPGVAVTFTADLRNDSDGVVAEAKAFLARNAYVKKPDSGSILRARLAALDPDAIAYREILERIGYRMKAGGGRAKPQEIHSYVFTAIQRLGPSGWKERLERSLRTTASAWGITQAAMTTPVVVGVALFHDTYSRLPQYDPRRLEQVLSKTTPTHLDAEGRSFAAMSRTSTEKGVCEVIRRQYNSRLLPKNVIPEAA